MAEDPKACRVPKRKVGEPNGAEGSTRKDTPQNPKPAGEVFLITPLIIPKQLGVVPGGKWMDACLFSSRVPF